MVFNDLTQSAVGIGIFAFVIVILSVMVFTLSGSVGCGGTGAENHTTWDSGTNLCYNAELGIGAGNTSTGGTPTTTGDFLLGALGSTGGGLASWTYIIVIAFVGALIIGLLFRAFGGSGNTGRY